MLVQQQIISTKIGTLHLFIYMLFLHDSLQLQQIRQIRIHNEIKYYFYLNDYLTPSYVNIKSNF